MVIGGANVDVVARSREAVQLATSNPGCTASTPGGVGRNIAENLARLGSTVSLVSVVGADGPGRRVVEQTREAGVDTAYVTESTPATGSYTAVVGPDGELVVAIADMRAIEALTPDELPTTLLQDSALLIADGNLPTPVLQRVLDIDHVPVMIDPVSAPKARRMAGLLQDSRPVHTITPDRRELAALSGLPAESTEDIRRAAGVLLSRGVQRVWVRRGPEGSTLVTSDGACEVPAYAVTPVDVTGAGDAMLAAYAHALLHGKDDVEAARDGAAAAYLTITSDQTVRPDLDEQSIARVRRHDTEVAR